LDEFKVYNRAMELAEDIWKVVATWNYFEKDTIGKQLARSADSIAAKLSEGLGRFHIKENKNFGYYSRGSLFETKTWLTKIKNRDLMDTALCDKLLGDLEIIGKMLNTFINTRKTTPPQDLNS